MGTPYVSEIRLWSFNFAPKGWAFCNGQIMAIAQFQVLYSLLGTYYGGDGIRTFGLPNLQGRVPLGVGSSGSGTYTLGQFGGEYQHTLLTGEMPSHNHPLNANNTVSGPQSTPSASTALGVTNGHSGAMSLYATGAGTNVLAQQTVGPMGGSQPHPNMMPYLALNYCIALQGIYPSRA